MLSFFYRFSIIFLCR